MNIEDLKNIVEECELKQNSVLNNSNTNPCLLPIM